VPRKTCAHLAEDDGRIGKVAGIPVAAVINAFVLSGGGELAERPAKMS